MFIKKFIVSIVLAVGIACCAGENNDKGRGQTTIEKNNDVAIRVECINSSNNSIVGFRVEVINLLADKNVVLVIQNNISALFDFCFINDKGLNISPMTSTAPMLNGPGVLEYRYIVMTPSTAYVCFYPVPSQVLADPKKLTNTDNLKIIPEDKYMAEIHAYVSYFIQDKITDAIPQYPNFQALRLPKTKIPVVIDKNSINSYVLKTYLDKDKK